ncbi:UDP-N-acetylglucosamine 2-epimerase (hydrolyzing) [Verminephrobacter aporrectodeae subsp. tuberculatae]|uniref:UDP-N-acetylglucosamine 2-epimerase (Hydrolyzing) n=1 Tax=Verminephrobacter aporrectodeae subsp. tuberculatae TaxID=1110392 RepID=A0ABT3KNY3_9BURK|nr:UDP-N-acetylglucosamine 2-epimerase [Verminephrobacter aporrectodeae]MCW5257726.1 UDP-N-acetylglucosamine 2-epimerase (hydrolyzing) [Verminephrobacter aporrectodeae subsp. tuberculatae]MCW5320012.1 UDP-N-acetylglucosamine 2-epimerase (hydrolyzing) [Verminephrobacter aporrectodeae subsp. tuberculatae]
MPSVCFVTLSRSDYASLRPVALAALADPAIDLRLIAGGSHALARYGNTLEQIRADGLPLHAVARFLHETDDSPSELAAAYARAVAQFVPILTEQRPDYVFVIGDRWELLAVVSAAAMLQIPIVHHSGGDITQGSSDNQTRYALSTLAHLHLVALPEHRERLLRMGEQDWRVITTGEPALTALAAQDRIAPDVHGRFGLRPGEPFVLATFHPTSFDSAPPERQVEVFLQALDGIACAVVLTAPNPDPASALFLARYRAYAAAHPNVRLYDSLGTRHYYAAMAQAQYMIGNSSSGLWESASFRLPVVNVGPRQQGRVHGSNVLHCDLDPQAIAAAIARATDPAWRTGLDGNNPYVKHDTLALILNCFKHPWDRGRLLAKRFMDPLTQRSA